MQWIPHFTAGNATIDQQHQALLAQCNALADCIDDVNETGDDKFPSLLDKLISSVRDHFAIEQELLTRYGYPMLDEHKQESEEFEHLAAEIISTDNFNDDELQSFLALWCTGHIVGTSGKQRPYLEQRIAS